MRKLKISSHSYTHTAIRRVRDVLWSPNEAANYTSLIWSFTNFDGAEASKFAMHLLTCSSPWISYENVLTTIWGLHTSKTGNDEYVAIHSLVLAWSMILFVWLLFIMFFWAEEALRHNLDLKRFKPRSYFKYLATFLFIIYSFIHHVYTVSASQEQLKTKYCWNTSFDIISRKGRKNID